MPVCFSLHLTTCSRWQQEGRAEGDREWVELSHRTEDNRRSLEGQFCVSNARDVERGRDGGVSVTVVLRHNSAHSETAGPPAPTESDVHGGPWVPHGLKSPTGNPIMQVGTKAQASLGLGHMPTRGAQCPMSACPSHSAVSRLAGSPVQHLVGHLSACCLQLSALPWSVSLPAVSLTPTCSCWLSL